MALHPDAAQWCVPVPVIMTVTVNFRLN